MERVVDVATDLVDRGAVDQWADRDPFAQPVADNKLRRRSQHTVGEFVVDAVLNENAVRADAGLAAVAELACHQSRHGEVDVGIVEHDEGRVAAQFETDAFDRRG